MHLNKKKHIHNRSKKNKYIRKSKTNRKHKSKRRNYEEMYYQPVAVPLIAFRSRTKSKYSRKV